MIGLLFVSHGKLADGVLDALQMIAGDQPYVETLRFQVGDSMEDFKRAISSKLDFLKSPEGTLIMADLLGGTPFNLAIQLMNEYKLEIITGLNLPLALTAVFSRDENLTLREFAESLIEAGKESIALF